MKPTPITGTRPRTGTLRERLGLPKQEPRGAPNREPRQTKDMTPKEKAAFAERLTMLRGQYAKRRLKTPAGK